jgi:hypothetical protein
MPNLEKKENPNKWKEEMRWRLSRCREIGGRISTLGKALALKSVLRGTGGR